MPPPLTVIQLSCFIAVAETRSFKEAGRRVGMTTSGISKTITRLEQGRGVRLLNRSTHSVSLTPEGERLLAPASEALRCIVEFDTAIGMAAAGGSGGRVRISAPTAFLNACLAPLLPRFHAELPGVTLDLRGSDEMVDLADAGVDVALRTGPLKGIAGHLVQRLFRFPWVTCASPAYLERRGKPIAPCDLAGHDLLGFRNHRTGLVDPWLYREHKPGRSQAVRIAPNPVAVLDDANAVATAAIAGTGIVWAPAWLVAPALTAATLIPLLTDWQDEEMTMSIVRRDGSVPERVEQVISFLKANRPAFG